MFDAEAATRILVRESYCDRWPNVAVDERIESTSVRSNVYRMEDEADALAQSRESACLHHEDNAAFV